jgi:hypothetical protein
MFNAKLLFFKYESYNFLTMKVIYVHVIISEPNILYEPQISLWYCHFISYQLLLFMTNLFPGYSYKLYTLL